MAYPADIMVIVASPDDFPSWAPTQKINRYARVVEWHAFVRQLNAQGKARWAWGSHALLSNFTMSGNQGTLVYVISTSTLEEFTQILEEDPLRDISSYITLPLSPIENDFEEDQLRLELRGELDIQGEKGTEFAGAVRSLYRKPPSFFDPANPRVARPSNPPCDMDEKDDYGISYLLYGTGLAEEAAWTDLQRMIYEEKVKWWHAFAADMVEQGKMTHAWATHGFCDSYRMEVNRRGGAVVLRANDFQEIDEFYRLNPLQQEGTFLSIALRPLGQQRESDIARLERARRRYT
jgi:hypothetical protein